MIELAESLNRKYSESDPLSILQWVASEYDDSAVFSTSLSAEDQVVLRWLSSFQNNISIFTLDTGRLFQETYDILEITSAKYNVRIDICFPDKESVEKLVNTHGPNLFYQNIENRKACCHIRKIEPLKRALIGRKVWITGLRREQGVTRTAMKVVEWDEGFQILKVNPLIHWTEEDVWNEIKEHNIPVSELYSKGYPSIGCMPCTRPVQPGEDPRSGRWWWELPHHKECGIHRKS